LAIFVVVAGVLLMLAGATALLFGFDIVMTERGSAMVIGGTVTLSGGTIAVGIGFALLKLNQILQALTFKNDRVMRPVSNGDRPVVPTPAVETVVPSQAVLAQTPPSTLAGVAVAGIAVAGVAAAGVAATSAAVGGHSIFSRSTLAPSSSDDAHSFDSDGVALAVEAPVEKTDSHSEPVSPLLVSSPDLEAELSRALAETDNSADQDRQFTAGLSEFLSKPKTDTSPVLLAKMSGETLPHDEEVAGDIDPLTEEELDAGEKDLAHGAGLSSTMIDHDDEDRAISADREPSDLNLEDLPDDVEGDGENHSSLDQAATLNGGAAPTTDILKPGVLRTYNSGGKSYTIYIDGTVETATDKGVERFASMDEFRSHLASS
jgi:hypothetical protein